MHTPKKSTNISSTIGRSPSAAAPYAAPMKAVSEIGVSMTRSGPKRSSKPCVAPKIPPYTPTSSPMTKTRSSRSISCAIASAIARAMVKIRSGIVAVSFLHTGITGPVSDGPGSRHENVSKGFFGCRVRALAREGNRLVYFCPCLALDLRGSLARQHPLADQALLEPFDRVLLLQLVDLILGPVDLRIALEVAEITVGSDLDQARAITPPGSSDGLTGDLVHVDRIIVRDVGTRNTVSDRSLAVSRNCCRLALWYGDGPGIVLDDKNHR